MALQLAESMRTQQQKNQKQQSATLQAGSAGLGLPQTNGGGSILGKRDIVTLLNQDPMLAVQVMKRSRDSISSRDSTSSTSSPNNNSTSNASAAAVPMQGNTKTEIFRQVHSCYRSTEPGKSSENVVPTYEDIERKLAIDSNINAARVATLRCRAIMRKALEPAQHLVPDDLADRIVVNCITALCPLCGRTIALNKLGSLENWCKHLSLHGAVGASLALRYRAFDKNSDSVPALHDLDQTQVNSWTALKDRSDAAPDDDDPRTCPINRVPMLSKINWEVLVYSQLLNDGAFDYRSVVSQELLATGMKSFGIPFHGPTHLVMLADMQKRLSAVPGDAFKVYLGENEEHHVDARGCYEGLIPGTCPDHEDTETFVSNALQGKDPLARVIWCALHLKTDRSIKIANVVHKLYKDFTEEEKNINIRYDTIEKLLDELDEVEGTKSGLRSRDAARLIVTRRRQILDMALAEIFPDERVRRRAAARVAVNAMVDSCPFCEQVFLATTFALDHAIFLDHLRGCKVNPQASAAFAARLVAFGTSAEDVEIPPLDTSLWDRSQFFPKTPVHLNDIRKDAMPTPVVDEKMEPDVRVDTNLAMRMDWSALMFNALIRAGILTCKSVLSQEIVALGLFFFGLVNQRSPQKFGQYPQLHSFQVALHRAGPQGYDEYCGLGIRDQHLGSSHIRGRPVAVTSSILRAYRHLGLSAKSLKRFAASARKTTASTTKRNQE